jgi:hypothetical protein
VLDFEQLAGACAPLGAEAVGLLGLLGWTGFTAAGRRTVRRGLIS